MPRLILVSNRLPVRVDAQNQATRTAGGLASALEGAGLAADTTWVGWPGIAAEQVPDEVGLRETLRKVGTVPVLLTENETAGYYDGYANATLWPVLHYMVDRARFDRDWFATYRAVNERFAQAVLEVAGEDDTVWIHDYHLFLLPQMLREQRPDLRIGYFLHTPFPSSELFRVLPQRREILEGVLGADRIGFHTYNYLRHFRSALLRNLGIESDVNGLVHDNRTVRIGVHPIGHNHVGFESAMAEPGFAEARTRYDESLAGRSLVLSVERLDYTKGVPQKLAAIRMFLDRHAALRDRVTFILIAVPSRTGMAEYDELTEDVQREVGAINGAFGTVGHAPVQFLHRGFLPTELAALYARADVCLVTPLIDGMNLVAKEFIACKTESSRPGALVLSEFAGAAAEMSQSLFVNPYDIEGAATAIADAIAMPDEEKRARAASMRGRLVRNHAGRWARQFVDDLVEAPPLPITGVERSSLEPLAQRLGDAVKAGAKLALFLDYDGTLRGFVDRPEEAIPDAKLAPLLARIAAHDNVHVAIVSGRKADFLAQHFDGNGLSLVAEHGYSWHLAGTEAWEIIDERVDTAWMDRVLPLLEQAADLTPGSRVERKRSAMVWHYRAADPEFGSWRARGLLSELTDITASLPVSVHHGNKIVEIASQLVNKGAAVQLLLDRWQPKHAVVAGDDLTDETMFALDPDGIDFQAISVGEGTTRAAWRSTRSGLRGLLERLDAVLEASDA